MCRVALPMPSATTATGTGDAMHVREATPAHRRSLTGQAKDTPRKEVTTI
jgi:hypothetical protein